MKENKISLTDFSPDIIFTKIKKENILKLPNGIIYKGNYFNSNIIKLHWINILVKCKTKKL